jgi:membrane-associated phospholipid phosphatase
VRRWLTALLVGYSALMGLALVYGAEHYVFDVLMGWAYAWGAWAISARGLPRRARPEA